jgi:hypothetical protein
MFTHYYEKKPKGGAMIEQRKLIYVAVLVLLSGAALTFRPGLWLTHKPASNENTYYTKGWEDGCISGTNSYSLLYAPFLDKPFVKALEVEPAPKEAPATASSGKDLYKSGWNEGFTLCRYYQSSVYDLMQFAILIATLLFIGYLLTRKKT